MEKTTSTTTSNPKWYGEKQSSAWDRTKAAFKRDWEQTKNDLGSKHAQDLNQNVGDTVKQATGSEPLPGMTQKTRPDETDWNTNEPALRYGFASRTQYKEHKAWDASLEKKLQTEWNDLKSGRTWDEAKHSVRTGWDKATSDNKDPRS